MQERHTHNSFVCEGTGDPSTSFRNRAPWSLAAALASSMSGSTSERFGTESCIPVAYPLCKFHRELALSPRALKPDRQPIVTQLELPSVSSTWCGALYPILHGTL